MKYYLKAFQNFLVFTGRANLNEFWYFVLFNLIISLIALTLDNVFGLNTDGCRYGLISKLYSVFAFFPGLAVSVRRLHDTGKSGWFVFIVLIPLIGIIWFLILAASVGNAGKNKYGPPPNKNQ